MTDWRDEKPQWPRVSIIGYLLLVLRIIPFAVVTYGGLCALLLLRLIEAPLAGRARPVTPYITQGVCKAALWLLGLKLRMAGQPMQKRGAVVANHASWLDIFVLNACDRVYFVAKSEVAGWPGIGWLARATGTVFIRRDPAKAKAQKEEFETRLRSGHRLLFFPEGTSTDSLRVLPFKSTLFQAFFAPDMKDEMHIQPVSLCYFAPDGAEKRFYGWWGEMGFVPHFLRILAHRGGGSVAVQFHAPLAVNAFASRKELAAACEETVRAGFEAGSAQDA